MNIDLNVLDESERIIYALRSLYMRRGYTHYRMSKFEEYDLYSRNKSFLVSDEIITFTDTDGKLMALKPDVTLSIIKNTRDDENVKRLCYNENVYRVTGGVRAFREIMQTGLECIGGVEEKEQCEVVELALLSLKELTDNYILEISDLNILEAFIRELRLGDEETGEILKLSQNKNVHEIMDTCKRCGADANASAALAELMRISARPNEALEKLKALCKSDILRERHRKLERMLKSFEGTAVFDHIRLDFSLSGDMNYYNGIVFKGYIEGIPESVLSGGQYDRLMQKLGRISRAIGFAVYLDRLERLAGSEKGGEALC